LEPDPKNDGITLQIGLGRFGSGMIGITKEKGRKEVQ
jgi:hypothetical protein